MRGTGLLDGYGAPLTATHYDGTCARAEVQRALPALGGLSGSRRRTLPCGEFDRRRRNCPTSCRSRSSDVEVASSARRRLAACGARSLFIAICGARRRWKNRARCCATGDRGSAGPARKGARRASACAQVILARLALRIARARADQGPLHLWRRRSRQDHADGSVLRSLIGRT